MNLGKPVPTLRASGFGLDLEVPEGAKVWLRGPNGSGKTTLLRALAGLDTHVDVRPQIDGADPRTWAARRLQDQVAYVPQDARHRLVGLTVAGEARIRGAHRDDDRDVATLSTGEAAKVSLDLLHAPVWLLDEPATHLDAQGRADLWMRIKEHEGTVLFTDHTGHLADLADATASLGGTATRPRRVQRTAGALRLLAPAQTSSWGVQLPEVSLGFGIQVIQGPNGSGKTSLLRILAGLDGTATWDGMQVRPGIDTAMVGPDPFACLLDDRVGDVVAANPLVPAHLLDRHPWTLSTGEAQRVALAKALQRDTPVLLLDEPEAHLDREGLACLLDILATRNGCTVIATHDPTFDPDLLLEAP